MKEYNRQKSVWKEKKRRRVERKQEGEGEAEQKENKKDEGVLITR